MRSGSAEPRTGTGRAKPGAPVKPGADPVRRSNRGAGADADGTAALALEVSAVPAEAQPATAQPAGRPRLWVAPPLPMRAPRATFAASVIAVVLLGVLGVLLVNTKTMEQSFKLDALQKEQAALDKQQQGLEQQLIQASNPGNIHAAARRLGLVMAENPAMIRLPDGKISRIPTPGRGQPGVTAQGGLKPGTATAGAGQ
ncbi:hypothetical protein [Actinoplanes sp. NPDC023714]|uniref:hypothetical protein n=1 Tax=Actinoplanes sp. NPDC023714 TaxID=3154322 RepID=UPI003408E52C